MTDIFSEVDEEIRKERFRKLWERYGIYVVAVAVLIVLGVGGWRAYEWHLQRQAAQSGAEFEAAIALSQEGKAKEAEAAFAKIAQEGTPSYRALAKLREANEVSKRDPKAAAATYRTLAGDPSLNAVLRDVAALRAGYIIVDSAGYDEVRKLLEPMSGADRTFRHSARSLLALSAWKAGNSAEARRWAEMISADPETPSAARGQAEILLTLTRPQAGT